MNIKENDLRDETGKYTRPITYNEFKNSLDEGRKKILAEYENSIIEFFSILDKNNLLKKEFADEAIKRLEKQGYTDLHVHSLIHNSYNIASKFRDVDFMNSFQNVAKSEGFNVEDIGEQVMIMIGMSYVYHVEYLKRNMLLLIDFGKMDLKKPDTLTFGGILNKLAQNKLIKEDMNKNIFINFLNAKKRNALAHFSYYFENSKMHLCIDGPFDPKPSQMEFYELMKESITMNVFSLSFYLIFISKYVQKELD